MEREEKLAKMLLYCMLRIRDHKATNSIPKKPINFVRNVSPRSSFLIFTTIFATRIRPQENGTRLCEYWVILDEVPDVARHNSMTLLDFEKCNKNLSTARRVSQRWQRNLSASFYEDAMDHHLEYLLA